MFIFFMLDLIKSFWMFIVDKRNVGFWEKGNKDWNDYWNNGVGLVECDLVVLCFDEW